MWLCEVLMCAKTVALNGAVVRRIGSESDADGRLCFTVATSVRMPVLRTRWRFSCAMVMRRLGLGISELRPSLMQPCGLSDLLMLREMCVGFAVCAQLRGCRLSRAFGVLQPARATLAGDDRVSEARTEAAELVTLTREGYATIREEVLVLCRC